MKLIFNPEAVMELLKRIADLPADSQPVWGKMNVYQMLKHCTLNEELFHGTTSYNRVFAGRLFGRMALNSILKNDAPMKKSLPTHPAMKITGTGDTLAQRNSWIRQLEQYGFFDNNHFIHPFFGKMTRDEIGQFVYKHADHHLRQFGG